MARLWTEGFEMQDEYFWDTAVGSISTGTARSGNASWLLSAGDDRKNVNSLGEFYMRIGWRFGTTVLATPFQWRNGTTVIGGIRHIASPNCFVAQVGTTTVATGTFSISTDTWYEIEVHVKIDNTLGSIQLKVDGVMDINFAGDTQPAALSVIDNLLFTRLSSEDYLDDLALNDTTGGADNSWCGDGHVILLIPNAAGDTTEWSASPTGSNYLRVDELPPNDDTDYVYSSTSGTVDLYNLTSSGLPSVEILRVWPEARARDDVAAGGLIGLPIKTNGVQYEGTSVSLLTTYTKQILGDARTVNPQTSAAWNVSELDALQVGVQVRS